MSSALETAREALAAALGEALAITAHAHVPEAVEPPCLVVQAADPYLVAGDTFAGDLALAFDVYLVTDLLSNEQATDDADLYLVALLAAVKGTGYGVDRVGRPGPVHTADWLANAIPVTVSTYITL